MSEDLPTPQLYACLSLLIDVVSVCSLRRVISPIFYLIHTNISILTESFLLSLLSSLFKPLNYSFHVHISFYIQQTAISQWIFLNFCLFRNVDFLHALFIEPNPNAPVPAYESLQSTKQVVPIL